MYKNKEGYPDPVMGEVMSKMMREYRQNRKATWARQHKLKNRQKIYVVSPYAGDTIRNTELAISYCQYVIEKGKMPVASHLLYPQMLDDDDPDEREMGRMFGLALLAVCHEVWVFGKNITDGMKEEIAEAERLNIPVRYIERIR